MEIPKEEFVTVKKDGEKVLEGGFGKGSAY